MKRIAASEPVRRPSSEGPGVHLPSGISSSATASRTSSAAAKAWTAGDRIHDGGLDVWPDCQD